MQITIWDNDSKRIAKIDRNLSLALKELSIKAIITVISEPPILARENLLNRVPVLEIYDHFWSLEPGIVFSKSDCTKLLQKIVV
jgi:hypothetical protein